MYLAAQRMVELRETDSSFATLQLAGASIRTRPTRACLSDQRTFRGSAMRVRTATLIIMAVSAALALSACRQSPSGAPSPGPASVQPSTSPAVARIVPGPSGVAKGTPPSDPGALSLARQWIAAAKPPPGVRILDAAPTWGPKQPATSVGCDWLVQATEWWSTDSARAATATAWLTQHPVEGLSFSGSMTGPGGQSSVIESAAQKHGLLEFEFAQDSDRVTVRVDAILVPDGAECASAGLAPISPARSVGG